MHKKSRVGFLARAKRVAALTFYSTLILVTCFHTTVAASTFSENKEFMTEDEKIEYYASIGNMFYDGSAKNACTRPGSCKVYGNTDDERLWSSLRNVGFTPEQTAALMGNIKNEGKTPVRQENAYITARNRDCRTKEGNSYTIWTYGNEHHAACMQAILSDYEDGEAVVGIGLGMVQWSSKGRREGYLEKMREAGYLQTYFEGDAYKKWGGIGTGEALRQKIIEENGDDGDYWGLYCTMISYIYYEMTETGEGKAFTEATSNEVGYLAGRVAQLYERCSHCTPGEASYNNRVASAEAVWSDYQNGTFDAVEAQLTGATLAYARSRQNGTLIAAGGGQTDAGGSVSGVYSSNNVDGSTILVIGDQSVASSSSALMAKMPGINILAATDKVFSAASGGQSGQIPANIVISLGLNDSLITEEQAKEVINSFSNKNIYFVLNYSDTEPDKYAANNATLGGIASVYNNVKVINWPKAVADAKAKDSGKTYFEADGVSPASPDGANLFAETIYKAFVGFDNAGTCGGGQYDPGDPLSLAKQFIVDLNYAYEQNLRVPQSFQYDVPMGVPGKITPTLNLSRAAVLKGLFNGAGPQESTSRCWGASHCGQCTALTQWFISMVTEYQVEGGCGAQVVDKLRAYPEIEILDHPEPMTIYSQFHMNDDGTLVERDLENTHCGHTGMVIDVKSDGSMITLENNMGPNGGELKVRTDRTIEGYKKLKTVYAKIPPEKMHFEHLGQTYE